jgi:hypothetical protein
LQKTGKLVLPNSASEEKVGTAQFSRERKSSDQKSENNSLE